jgi:hypothetical protein
MTLWHWEGQHKISHSYACLFMRMQWTRWWHCDIEKDKTRYLILMLVYSWECSEPDDDIVTLRGIKQDISFLCLFIHENAMNQMMTLWHWEGQNKISHSYACLFMRMQWTRWWHCDIEGDKTRYLILMLVYSWECNEPDDDIVTLRRTTQDISFLCLFICIYTNVMSHFKLESSESITASRTHFVLNNNDNGAAYTGCV